MAKNLNNTQQMKTSSLYSELWKGHILIGLKDCHYSIDVCLRLSAAETNFRVNIEVSTRKTMLKQINPIWSCACAPITNRGRKNVVRKSAT